MRRMERYYWRINHKRCTQCGSRSKSRLCPVCHQKETDNRELRKSERQPIRRCRDCSREITGSHSTRCHTCAVQAMRQCRKDYREKQKLTGRCNRCGVRRVKKIGGTRCALCLEVQKQSRIEKQLRELVK